MNRTFPKDKILAGIAGYAEQIKKYHSASHSEPCLLRGLLYLHEQVITPVQLGLKKLAE
jgi:hypothetical protein